MTSVALGPVPRGLHGRLRRRHWRKRVSGDETLLSVAGLLGAPVLDESGERVGTVEDLLVDGAAGHPALHGVVVRERHRPAYVHAFEIAALLPGAVRLRPALVHRVVDDHPGLVGLRRVLDRQVVDADGCEVARISDLLLSQDWEGARLVGSDVSARTLIRRLGPASWRRRVAPDRVYDWSAVARLSPHGDAVLRLTGPASRLEAAR